MLVVDGRVLLDHVAAAVEAPVADRDLKGFDADRLGLAHDLRMERTGAGEHPDGREGVAELAEAAFDVASQLLRQFGGEADASHVEERVAVDEAEVDAAGSARSDNAGGGIEIGWDAEGASKIVGGAHRQDAE